MARASTPACQTDTSFQQPRQDGHVIQPTSRKSYQCELCPRSFLCHEPLQHHASTHDHTVRYVYMECKQPKPDIIALHDVYCRRRTHYVRVTTSTPLGPFSAIQQIDEIEELSFEEFLKRGFSSTETHKETVRRMKEFDKRCCRPVHETITFITKKLVSRLLSCLLWTPVPEQSRSSRWPSRPDTISKSHSQSIETLTANDRRSQHADDLTLTASLSSRLDTRLESPSQSIGAIAANDKRSQDVDDPASTARNSLPKNLTAIVAVASFYSTADGVHCHKVLVATHSNTIILLGLVDLDALLRHAGIKNQLPQIIGDYAYTELLEYRKKRMNIENPVYQGILPDDLPIGVGEEVRLEDCSPVLEAEVRSILDS
ncbi:hypothetical protein COCHEDRAFT_1228697 [Bipolaris maydis C5]|uniref:C2H2-type domain-containing protein n=2 Tax=Cochliobolus heterostrophus TaxID=5016 RepID=M2SJU5_COCH5|nr:hypothetical protein COCHEDRAFT_1228697 [Bipolaris maydis C5]KAJ5028967.1 hypothetical protein J3E73DRAFT_408114 [Bipolaris maydis]KAJ5063746.1 hypothetical protein J3E74DRAFT_446548 [Bipolaris maydis]KAJ6208631.1 hypothetical protein PSV09DRAFT_1228697 [Bipolaris maydis]KAJ6273136.1 hypothetical protein PSV08DRAFT_400663 [Bipolaris maydis]